MVTVNKKLHSPSPIWWPILSLKKLKICILFGCQCYSQKCASLLEIQQKFSYLDHHAQCNVLEKTILTDWIIE